MGGKCKHEPEGIEELRAKAQVTKVFHKFNLLEFFNKFQGYNNQLALEFAEGFVSNFVVLKGHEIPITPNSIHEFMGLPKTREDLIKREQCVSLLSQFHPSNEPKAEIYSTQGHVQKIKRETLPEKWLMRYLSCEGQHPTLMCHHLKLLTCLRYKKYQQCNLSKFLYQNLQKMAKKVRGKSRGISHPPSSTRV